MHFHVLCLNVLILPRLRVTQLWVFCEIQWEKGQSWKKSYKISLKNKMLCFSWLMLIFEDDDDNVFDWGYSQEVSNKKVSPYQSHSADAGVICPIWWACNSTFSIIRGKCPCLICAIKILFFWVMDNHDASLQFWRLPRPSSFRGEILIFEIANTGNIGRPPESTHLWVVEISVMTRYLDDQKQWRPKMLGVDAHLYRLLPPQI